MKLCVALDDFSEEIMTKENWDILLDLKKEYPNLKVTMFTIPEQSGTKWIESIYKKYKWIEMQRHGTDHSKTKSQVPTDKSYGMNDIYFGRVFKAPWWKLTKEEFDKMKSEGWLIATNKTNKFKGDYVYDDGREVIKDICYELDNGVYTWHGHVQSQRKANPHNPNGLPDVVALFKKHISKNTEFKFVSEVIENGS